MFFLPLFALLKNRASAAENGRALAGDSRSADRCIFEDSTSELIFLNIIY